MHSNSELLLDRVSLLEMCIRDSISIIQSQSDLITAQISKTDYLSGEKSKITDVELQQMANLYNGRILVVNKEFRIIKDTDPVSYTHLDVYKRQIHRSYAMER